MVREWIKNTNREIAQCSWRRVKRVDKEKSLCTAVSQSASEAQQTLPLWVSGVGGASDDDYPLTPRARAALLLGDR